MKVPLITNLFRLISSFKVMVQSGKFQVHIEQNKIFRPIYIFINVRHFLYCYLEY